MFAQSSDDISLHPTLRDDKLTYKYLTSRYLTSPLSSFFHVRRCFISGAGPLAPNAKCELGAAILRRAATAVRVDDPNITLRAFARRSRHLLRE